MARKKVAQAEKEVKPIDKQVEDFKKKDASLKAKNYVPTFIFTEEVGRTKSQAKIDSVQSHMANYCGRAGDVGTEIWINRYRTPVSCPNCGAEDRGYIKCGDNDRLYVNIQKAAEALPYTASILRFIIDLLCGSGQELRYRYTKVVNGSVVEYSCRYEDAGGVLDSRIAELRKLGNTESRNFGNEEAKADALGTDAVGTGAEVASGISLAGVGVEPMSYRVKKEEPVAEPSYVGNNYEKVGTVEAMLEEAIQDKREWERCMAEWQEIKDNSTDLDVLLRQWASDQSFFALGYLKLALEQGKPRQWGVVGNSASGAKLTTRPKIVGVNYIPCVCARMEQMSDELKIENIYYAEKFRYDGTIKDQLHDIVAYPSIMPEGRKKMLEKIVLDNQATTPNKRPQVVMPIYIPQFDSPYYPVHGWWSIFSSMLYLLANTIVNDAVTERKNSTMFSYLIYLNMTWFEKYCADNHFDTDEEKEQAKKDYLQKISDFLKNKQNNGRIAALESITSADEKNILKSIEIVEVPHTTSKASLEDMEMIGNAIFFAFGVHSSMVGSFGKTTTSSSGTQQRELTLLKQCQLMPQQRLYLNAWDFILRWNEFDKHAYMSIKQYDLSTLDASKTGLVERE